MILETSASNSAEVSRWIHYLKPSLVQNPFLFANLEPPCFETKHYLLFYS